MDPTESAIPSTDADNPTLEPNVKWIGRSVAEISPFEILLLRGVSSVGHQVYRPPYTDVIYSSSLRLERTVVVRYVGIVAREE